MSLLSFPTFPHVQPGGLLAAIVAGEPPPTQLNSPQQTQAGAYTAWDTFRAFWGQTAPWQHDVLASIRDQFGGIG